MISKTIGFRGLAYFQTHPDVSKKLGVSFSRYALPPSPASIGFAGFAVAPAVLIHLEAAKQRQVASPTWGIEWAPQNRAAMGENPWKTHGKPWKTNILEYPGTYPLVIMAIFEIAYKRYEWRSYWENHRTKWWIFQLAMFDNQMVFLSCRSLYFEFFMRIQKAGSCWGFN